MQTGLSCFEHPAPMQGPMKSICVDLTVPCAPIQGGHGLGNRDVQVPGSPLPACWAVLLVRAFLSP